MKLPKDQPFWTSVILHVIVLLGLLLSVLINALKREEPEHVFEMVSASSVEALPDSPSTQESQPSLDLPNVEPMAELPDVTVVEQPTVPPSPPAPAVKPSLEPKPQLMSLDDFRKKNPLKEPQQQRTSKPRTTLSAPTISVPQLVIPRSSASSSASLTQAQISALGKYQSRLWSLLNAAWAKPSNLGGIQLTAVVTFDVSSSGQISNVRLKRGSGNYSFDQSILAAFRKVTNAGPTPTGQSHRFEMPFKLA